MFDFQEETLEKHDEELTDIYHTRMNFPIPTTNQRFPFKAHFFERINDIDLNMAHIIPNLNIHGIDRDKVWIFLNFLNFVNLKNFRLLTNLFKIKQIQHLSGKDCYISFQFMSVRF